MKITCSSCRKTVQESAVPSLMEKVMMLQEKTVFLSHQNAFSSEIEKTVERSEGQWILDGNASTHINYDLYYFNSFNESNDNKIIHLRKKLQLAIKGSGILKIQMFIDKEWQE